MATTTITAATIPVDDDVGLEKYTGYAVANPGRDKITIKAMMINSDGTVAGTLNPINLDPSRQIAAFLFQDPNARLKSQGSLVLIAQGSATFSVVALVQNHGLYTAIPAIPSKPPGIN